MSLRVILSIWLRKIVKVVLRRRTRGNAKCWLIAELRFHIEGYIISHVVERLHNLTCGREVT